jgi:hypothetical protein
MTALDFKRELKQLYQPSAKDVVEVDVTPMRFLMIDGEGDPNVSKAYADAVEALYAVSYTAKFMLKKGPAAIDFGVMPLEALWWADDMAAFAAQDKSHWKWTVMIMQPPPVTADLVAAAIADVKAKAPRAALPRLRYDTLAEGRCAQILHVGPFTAEGPTIERVHRYIESRGARRSGKHHEIYLSDIRRADPARWKTVIRQPMTQVQTAE